MPITPLLRSYITENHVRLRPPIRTVCRINEIRADTLTQWVAAGGRTSSAR
jgi:hypothetical protein